MGALPTEMRMVSYLEMGAGEDAWVLLLMRSLFTASNRTDMVEATVPEDGAVEYPSPVPELRPSCAGGCASPFVQAAVAGRALSFYYSPAPSLSLKKWLRRPRAHRLDCERRV